MSIPQFLNSSSTLLDFFTTNVDCFLMLNLVQNSICCSIYCFRTPGHKYIGYAILYSKRGGVYKESPLAIRRLDAKDFSAGRTW